MVGKCVGGGGRYGPVELGAIWRILGMVTEVLGSAGLVARCSLRA